MHGQFEPDSGHPIIHYTHHATGKHEGGYIQLRNRSYAIGQSSTDVAAPAARGGRGESRHGGPLLKGSEDIGQIVIS